MNICTYLLVSYFTGKQGVTIWSQLGIDQGRLKGDFLIGLALLLPSLVVGFAGLYGVAYLLWGTQPADPRFQALPLSAVLLAAVAFPRFVIYRLAGFLPLTVLFGYLYTRATADAAAPRGPRTDGHLQYRNHSVDIHGGGTG